MLPRKGHSFELGLAIVRAIVTAHGGTIAVHSQGEGCGSEFVVRLPVHSAAAVSVSGNDARSDERSAALPSARPRGQ